MLGRFLGDEDDVDLSLARLSSPVKTRSGLFDLGTADVRTSADGFPAFEEQLEVGSLSSPATPTRSSHRARGSFTVHEER